MKPKQQLGMNQYQSQIQCHSCGRSHRPRECKGYGHFAVFHTRPVKRTNMNHSNAVHTVVEEQHTSEPELVLGPVQVLNMDAADGSRDYCQGWRNDFEI